MILRKEALKLDLPLATARLKRFIRDYIKRTKAYGVVLGRLGRWQEALVYLSRSVWLRDGSANKYHLGLTLSQLGRNADAEKQLRRALKLVGDDQELEEKIRSKLADLRSDGPARCRDADDYGMRVLLFF